MLSFFVFLSFTMVVFEIVVIFYTSTDAFRGEKREKKTKKLVRWEKEDALSRVDSGGRRKDSGERRGSVGPGLPPEDDELYKVKKEIINSVNMCLLLFRRVPDFVFIIVGVFAEASI